MMESGASADEVRVANATPPQSVKHIVPTSSGARVRSRETRKLGNQFRSERVSADETKSRHPCESGGFAEIFYLRPD